MPLDAGLLLKVFLKKIIPDSCNYLVWLMNEEKGRKVFNEKNRQNARQKLKGKKKLEMKEKVMIKKERERVCVSMRERKVNEKSE
jgi:hypothetical protein